MPPDFPTDEFRLGFAPFQFRFYYDYMNPRNNSKM